mmetsp:Transcript_106078/g.193001  ORF Transcript_106078/g.193001 Transcript_106078/m.193001 type:complete len:570 (+) Transcript_106078:84-1793(+)
MIQQKPPLFLPVEQQTPTADKGLDTLGDFNQLAAGHVQVMLNRLIADHQSIVQSLQSEITLLRKKNADPDGTHASPKEPEESDAVPLELNTCDAPTDDTISEAHATNAKIELYLKDMPGDSESLEHKLEGDLDTAPDCKQIMLPDSPPTLSTTDAQKSVNKGASVLSAGPSRVRNFVLSNTFELITGSFIVINTIVMAMQQQYDGFDMGYEIRPEDYSKPANETWPGGEIVFSILDNVFNALFSSELLLRFFAHGLHSIRMPWMWFDTTVVSLGLVDSMTSGGGIGIDPSMIRLVRLVRLIRLLKIFQSMTHFDSLFLLLKAIQASVQALVWSLLLLATVMIGASLFLGQILSPELMDTRKDPKVRDQLFMYFGTFSRTMMTMVEITLGNWVPSCRLLMENVHEVFFLFFLLYRCMFCFSVLRVINAVFISETNRVLACDAELTMAKGDRDRKAYEKQLRQVLKNMDSDNSGTVSWDEVEAFVQDVQISRLLHTIGFSRDHVEKVFEDISENDNVNIEKFVKHLLALRGYAKAVDVHCNDRAIQEILRCVRVSDQYGRGLVKPAGKVAL